MKTKLIVIGVVAALAVTGVWFVALWSPQGAKLQTAQTEKQAAEKKVADLRARLANAKRLEANAEKLERDRVKLSIALPDTDQLDDFIRSVNAKASAANVSFVSIAPAEPAATGATPGAPAPAAVAGPTTVSLQMQVTGTYHDIMRFFESLRIEGERLMVFDNVTMNKPPADGQPVTASITGKMFINRPVPAAAATTATTATTAPATKTAS